MHRQGLAARLPARLAISAPPHRSSATAAVRSPGNDEPSWGSRPLRRSCVEASRRRGSQPTVVTAIRANTVAGPAFIALVAARPGFAVASRSRSLFAPSPAPPARYVPTWRRPWGSALQRSDRPRAGITFLGVTAVRVPALLFLGLRAVPSGKPKVCTGMPEPRRLRVPNCNQPERAHVHEPLRVRPVLPSSTNFRLVLKRLPLQAWRTMQHHLAEGGLRAVRRPCVGRLLSDRRVAPHLCPCPLFTSKLEFKGFSYDRGLATSIRGNGAPRRGGGQAARDSVHLSWASCCPPGLDSAILLRISPPLPSRSCRTARADAGASRYRSIALR